MESRNGPAVHPAHTPGHPAGHRPEIKPIDGDYRLVVRTTLWVIAGLVFVGFVIWWALT